MNEIHNRCNVNKLDDRRSVHLLIFVYGRAQNEKFISIVPRELKRLTTQMFVEHRSNKKSFERSILYQGVLLWYFISRGSIVERPRTKYPKREKFRKTKKNAF